MQTESGRERETWSPLLATCVIVFAALTALYFAWPVWRAFLPLQIVNSDAWNTYHVDELLRGRPLYPAPDALVVNNYPPLSFYFVGALSTISGLDALLVGRLLSLFGTVAAGLAAGVVIRQLGGSRIGAMVGALSFVGTAARYYALFVGINDPHLVALAIMLWAQVWLFQRMKKGRSVEPAIVLMVVGGFYKYTLLALPVTSLVFLALCNRRRALRAALVGVGTSALGLVVCGLVYGHTFYQNLLMPRVYLPLHPLLSLGRLQWIAPALIIFVVWAWHQRQGPAVRFAGLFVIFAFIDQFLQLMSSGAADNAHFELIAAASIGVGLAFSDIAAIPLAQRWGLERARVVIVLILVVRLLLSLRMSPYLLIFSSDFHSLIQKRIAIAESETARIAAIPGPVSCSVMMVCRSAGKRFLYDRFAIGQRIITGHTSQDVIDRRVREIGLRFETIDPRADLDVVRLP